MVVVDERKSQENAIERLIGLTGLRWKSTGHSRTAGFNKPQNHYDI
jgi:hypothetical protein